MVSFKTSPTGMSPITNSEGVGTLLRAEIRANGSTAEGPAPHLPVERLLARHHAPATRLQGPLTVGVLPEHRLQDPLAIERPPDPERHQPCARHLRGPLNGAQALTGGRRGPLTAEGTLSGRRAIVKGTLPGREGTAPVRGPKGPLTVEDSVQDPEGPESPAKDHEGLSRGTRRRPGGRGGDEAVKGRGG